MPDSETATSPHPFYWLLAAVLIILGFRGAAHIGLMFFPIGAAMVLLGIRGGTRFGFWPPILGLLVFVASCIALGYLVGPLSCNTVVNVAEEIRPGETESRVIYDNTRTTCASPLLPSKIRGYGPPFWPIALASTALGVGAAYISWFAQRRRRAKRPQLAGTPPLGEVSATARPASPFYWIGTIAVIIFGFLGILSVGFPFLVLGIALVVLSPYRARPAIFWPPLAFIVLFVVTFILIAPLGCSQTATPVLVGIDARTQAQPGLTSCTRILLPDSSGPVPSMWPSLAIAAATGAVGGVVMRLWLRRRQPHNAMRS